MEDAIDRSDDEVGLGRSAHVRRLRRVDAVIFDCDSTLSAVEGIDELAREAGIDVSRLTDAAMRGEIALEDVYGHRMSLVRPDRAGVERLGELYIERLVPDAKAVVAALTAEGIDVRIMSGGLRPAVEAVGRALNIAPRNVAAVDIRFDAQGNYAGFDELSPLARSHGKSVLLEVWRRELHGTLMFVGDGITDLETRGTADVFVAYAGVIARPPVLAAADVVVRSYSLAPILPLALGGRRPASAPHQLLFDQGMLLLEDVYRSYLGNGNAA